MADEIDCNPLWEQERPAFEVINPATGDRMKVYESGKTEGFPSGFTVVMNRIPLLIREGQADVLAADMGER